MDAPFAMANKIDKTNMHKILYDFSEQILHAIEIIEKTQFQLDSKINKFIILGMGGSAIGGDLLRSYLKELDGVRHIQIIVNRNYEIPDFIDQSWCAIASSYSGGTEETISAYEQVKFKTNNIIVIASGGELEKLANNDGYPIIKIPKGFMPRCALGYSFFCLLKFFVKSGVFGETNNIDKDIKSVVEILNEKRILYSNISENNLAYELARKIKGKIPIIYSNDRILDVVNLRWRAQIQENAKNLAFGAFLPEMNHNEINSWQYPEHLMKNFIILLLKDKNDHPQIKRRFAAIREIFNEIGIEVIELESTCDNLLARQFDLIYLGDWVSYWLAILNGIDPTPIPLISKLKEILSK